MRWTVRSAKVRASLLALCVAIASAPAPATGDALRAGFESPPQSARPRVWWHWMNGNITREGIKADLEWMQRTGIAGFQNFDAALGTAKVVDQRLVYMTPEWSQAFRYATQLADQLGLEEAIAGSPGWSESGGPWVSAKQGMKKLVWTETHLEGGKPFSGRLAQPPSAGGPLQDSPFADDIASSAPRAVNFYADSAVVAFRVPEAELSVSALKPVVTSSSGNIDAALLADGHLDHTVALPIAPVGESSWVQFDYGAPHSIRGLTFARNDRTPFQQFGGGPTAPELQASDDGVQFHRIVVVPGDGSAAQHTLAFPEVRARYYRLVFVTPAKSVTAGGLDIDFSSLGFSLPPPAKNYLISELALHEGARVNRFEEKAGFALLADLSALPAVATPDALAVNKHEIIDLTSRMSPEGNLEWTPPDGQWVVLRMGYSPTGVTNHPASAEGTGLEVDKLSARHVRDYMQQYLDHYKNAVGPLMGKRGLQFVVNDSWEAGAQNWTDDLIAEFSRRRHYELRPWLPALTGRVVESAAATDRFLWDFRRTLGDLLAENHYDQITALLKARGMGHYGESHESGRAFIGDGMEAKRSNDVPMSAMWTQRPGADADQPGYNADIRESASVAHIYGQNLVAAESLTAASGAWSWSPETLKPTADKELAMGLNRFVIHTSVHQPLLDKGPGLSLGPFGQWFTRNETWSGAPAQAWVRYLSRSAYLLQQGRFVADIAYFYGEDSNITALFSAAAPPIPAGYNFDYVNADALIHKFSVHEGALATPSGMRYRILALDPRSVHMSLPVLRQIRSLVAAGAVVVGLKPTDSPSLADDQMASGPQEFHSLADALWGASAANASHVYGYVYGHVYGHVYGKGRVYATTNLRDVLQALSVTPDFEFAAAKADNAGRADNADPSILAVHRKLASGDLYFVSHRVARKEQVVLTFRVHGRAPELWHADTGDITPTAYRIEHGRTIVPMALDPWESVFVVFRRPTSKTRQDLPKREVGILATLDGPWPVAFQADRGAPVNISVNALASWSDSADQGVKYFSGTGTYTRTVQVQPGWLKAGTRIGLELGEVKNLAEVSVNGRNLGVLWKKPFHVDVTSALHPGANEFQIKVTNLWVNRMIGDRQADAARQYTFTAPKFYKADSPLLPSGLLGPVSLTSDSPTGP